MADRGDTEPDQILGREVHEDLGVDVVLPERLFVLSQPQTTQPGRDVHGLLPAFVFRAPGARANSKMSGRIRGNTPSRLQVKGSFWGTFPLSAGKLTTL